MEPKPQIDEDAPITKWTLIHHTQADLERWEKRGVAFPIDGDALKTGELRGPYEFEEEEEC